MQVNNNFSLFILKDQKYDIYFFRSHITFFSKLLLYIVENKKNFLLHPTLLYLEIKQKLLIYNKRSVINSISYKLFSKIIFTIDKIYNTKNTNLYSYILNFTSIMLQKGYYEIVLCNISSLQEYNEVDMKNLIFSQIEKHKINSKLVFIGINKRLIKGITIQYKDIFIDYSLKNLSQILLNKIKINSLEVL